MGVFLGASLITVLEVVMFIGSLLYKLMASGKKGKICIGETQDNSEGQGGNVLHVECVSVSRMSTEPSNPEAPDEGASGSWVTDSQPMA